MDGCSFLVKVFLGRGAQVRAVGQLGADIGQPVETVLEPRVKFLVAVDVLLPFD